MPWEQVLSVIHGRFGHYHWVHVIKNTVAIAAALPWGDAHFGRSIGMAVGCGWETDSTGATHAIARMPAPAGAAI